MRNSLYMDIHVLQTVPPSCVNRDDTGSPKTAFYGGVTRARVSSQAWKKAMRDYFRQELPAEEVGKRTKLLHALLVEEIRARAPEADAEKLAKDGLAAAGVSVKEGDKRDALFFVSPGQLAALAEVVLGAEGGKLDKKECQKAMRENPAVDIALFGRMAAEDPSLNYDAAAQVAHAISTHAVQNEFDFFTALDDCAPEGSMGAAHMDTAEYNSSTLYRYATVNIGELAAHLGGRTPEAVRVFLQAFLCSMPTGKRNSYANNTLPDAVYVAIRRDQPLNLAGAFEKPVTAGMDGYVQPSMKAFVRHAKALYRDYLGEPEEAFAIGSGMAELADPMPMRQVLDAVQALAAQWGAEA